MVNEDIMDDKSAVEQYKGFPVCKCGGAFGNTTYSFAHIHLPPAARTAAYAPAVKVGDELPLGWVMSEAGALWMAQKKIPWQEG